MPPKKTSPSIPSFLSGCFIYYFVPRFYAPQWFASRLHLPLSKVSPFDHRKPLPIPWHLHWKPQTSLDPDDHEELGCTRRSARTLKKSAHSTYLEHKGRIHWNWNPTFKLQSLPTQPILSKKNVWKIQPFLFKKIRNSSTIWYPPPKKNNVTPFNFVFSCFASTFVWQQAVFLQFSGTKSWPYNQRVPRPPANFQPQSKCLNGQKDWETLGNVGNLTEPIRTLGKLWEPICEHCMIMILYPYWPQWIIKWFMKLWKRENIGSGIGKTYLFNWYKTCASIMGICVN